MSDSDDNNNNEIAARGFGRFRANSVISMEDDNSSLSTTLPLNSPPPSDSIAEYCAESLYSYSFTPLSRVNRAAKIKRQILNQGMDYLQRAQWKANGRESRRRFSQPDIGILNYHRNNPSLLNDYWLASDTSSPQNNNNSNMKPFSTAVNDNSKNSDFTPSTAQHPFSIKINPDVKESYPEPQSALPFVGSNKEDDLFDTIAPINPPTGLDDDDDGNFNFSRRQTIGVSNGLPPIYESPKRLSNTGTPTSSRFAQYSRALHAPSRYLPQNQAILTTDADATVLLFNDMASLCFGIDKSYAGKSILTILEEPFKKQMSSILRRRRHLTSIVRQLPAIARESRLEKGLVLVCGVVVPIKKMSGETSAASLWLKEKLTDEGKSIYIWIFEEIYETSLSVQLDEKGNVIEMMGTTKALFGYEPEQIVGNPISQLMPALSENVPNCSNLLECIDKLKFYGGSSKDGAYFPTMLSTGSSSRNIVKIVSLPSIAGLITVHSNTGQIQSINPVPSKYLFGYSPESLMEKVNIDQIIPQFSNIVAGLRRCNLLQYACTVNNHACRWVISDMCGTNTTTVTGDDSTSLSESLKSLERKPSINASGQSVLPQIYAVHRDGSQFEIQLQLRLIQSEEEDLVSAWVTYDRIYALKRSKRAAKAQLRKQSLPVSEVAVPSLSVAPTDHLSRPSSDTDDGVTRAEKEQEENEPEKSKTRPSIRPRGISLFGSVDQSKALFPGGVTLKDEAAKEESVISSLEVTEKDKSHHPMDDYVIIGTLGEGAYGTAKLAYRKDDKDMTKVVIKLIAKSRIIVDSWIRDRQLGLIPLEIHILKKLKEHPQVNCCALETYMEDEDTYYVVMKVYGLSSMDLFDYIELNEKIEEEEVRNIFRQVALAVSHIQMLHIVHRDIKDENILLDETGCVHLIDFGSAAYFKEGRTFDTFGGTLDYCAPEILKGMPYEGPAQDIWSLGTLLYTLIYRENPFYNVDEILEHDLRIPFVLSEGSLDLIKKMLNRDVEKRYTIQQVLEHPWLNTTA
ncbi:MAG: hypothetical protein EXX96DRAFT_552654 [Benjaminiella poitrasii]|nr:MAG: hypothetical protein EXX96DRAFT_552654 [Benjaminiella poitrasii]